MDISTDVQQDISIVSVTGKIDAVTVMRLDEEAHRVAANGAHRILFDFTGVTYINSSGLRVILATAKTQKNNAGIFALCGVCGEVEKVFRLAGFTSILIMYPGRAEAMAAMKPV